MTPPSRYARLSPGEPAVHHATGEQAFVHHYFDDNGVKLGSMKLVPRGDTLHVVAMGRLGGDNALGPRHVAQLGRSLAEMYPNATHVAGLRIGGFRAGMPMENQKVRVALPRRRMARKPLRPRIGNLPTLIHHAGAALDNPHDPGAVSALADHLLEEHPEDPHAQAFAQWVNGQKTWPEIAPIFRDAPIHPRRHPHGGHDVPGQPYVLLRPMREGRNYPQPEPEDMAGLIGKVHGEPYWKRFRSSVNVRWIPHPSGSGSYRRMVKVPDSEMTGADVANHLYQTDGTRGLILGVIGARHFRPDNRAASENGTGVKFRRRLPKRYAKVDGHEPAHHLVAGFPIEHMLRHLANDPKNSENVRDLAMIALTGKGKNDPVATHEGKPEALWLLHDALRDEGHPAAEHYNWMSAADKVQKDAKVHQALRHVASLYATQYGWPHGSWEASPEAVATRIRSQHRYNEGDARNRTRETVHQTLRNTAPELTPDEIDESLKRHAYRARTAWFRHNGVTTKPQEEDAVAPFGGSSDETWAEEEKASRYRRKRYAQRRNDFIDALRRIKSTNQRALHQVAQRLAAKLGLHPVKVLNGLHDSPQGSTPGIAQAVYGNASPENVHSAAAWIGLTSNQPGVAVFHVRPNGPDSLYRVRHEGSGLDLRARLDRFGIRERVLIPHKKGFDVLIPDKGGAMRDRVQQYAQATKTVPEESRGHFSTIGSADQARARELFRNTVVRQEHWSQQPVEPDQPTEPTPMSRNRIRKSLDFLEAVRGND